MQDFNQVTFTGRLGKDPEMSYTPTGTALTKFSLAVNRLKAATGGKEQTTIWFNVTCWQKLGEIVNEYARKGGRVLVQGTFDVREYTDRSGVKRTAYDITASTVQLLDSKPQSSASSSDAPLGELDEHPF